MTTDAEQEAVVETVDVLFVVDAVDEADNEFEHGARQRTYAAQGFNAVRGLEGGYRLGG